MKVRSLHFDMKGMIPKAGYMQSLTKDIASWGFNHLLVEFEDKFPYRCCPFARHPAAYTRKQLAALNSPGLRVIPLLQCAGHLDYLLKYPQMRELRKDGKWYQWDMSRPEVFDLWRKMADEILEVFPDCEYFHIGADEVEMTGPGDFETYVRHVERCAEYLRKKGKKVIIWDDMFRKHDLSKLQGLLHKTIVQVWQYREVDEHLVRNLIEAGAEVWGASRIQEDRFYCGIGSQVKMRKNADDWTEVSAKYGLQGHTGTIWGRIQSTTPLCATLPQSMYMIAYLGESLTSGRKPNLTAFHRKLGDWFGIPSKDIAGLAANFHYEPEAAAKFLKEPSRHGDIMEIWRVLNGMDCLSAYINDCFSSNNAMFRLYREGGAPPKTTNNYLDGVRIIGERVEAMKQEIDSVLGKYFPPSLLEEFKSERFDSVLFWNEIQKKELLRAQKKFSADFAPPA